MSDEPKQDALAKRPETAVALPSAQNLRMLAQDFVNSGVFPLVKSVPEAITKIQAGYELGVPPVASLNTMTVINGRLTMDAKLLLAIAHKRAEVSWKVLQETDDICEMEFSRPGFSPIVVSFTAQEAQTAGLLTKANWKNYRRDMLFARCGSRGVRRIAPDAVLGLYGTEEMRDAQVFPESEENARRGVAGGPSSSPSEAPSAVPGAKNGTSAAGAGFFSEPGAVVEGEVVEEGEKKEDAPDAEGGFFGAGADEGQGGDASADRPLFSDDAQAGLVDAIKEALRVEGVDLKDWKNWMYEYQRTMKPPRKFVGKKFNAVSLHEGDAADLKWLHGKIGDSIRKYLAWKKGQAK